MTDSFLIKFFYLKLIFLFTSVDHCICVGHVIYFTLGSQFMLH